MVCTAWVSAAAAESRGRRVARALVGALVARARPYLPALLVSAVLGAIAIRQILAAAGHPSAPLDDTFIHLQYAKRLAQGRFFSYVAGEPYTTGATSIVWPLVLAPFWALGLRGASLLWAAWGLGTLAHAAVAVETARLARPLVGRGVAVGAACMSLAFGAFAWFAWSGMETVALAWILLRTARLAAARLDHAGEKGEPGSRAALSALGLIAPLVRPEGALASLVAATAIAWRPQRGSEPTRRSPRAMALAPLAGPAVVPLLHLLLAGHLGSSTAQVKWLVGNPYYPWGVLRAAVVANVRMLITDLLAGGDWTAIFVPEGFSVVLGLGLFATAVLAHRAPWHAVFVAVVAVGALLPCTYLSFLWNRVRYLWPFAGAWFVAIACLVRLVGDGVRRATGVAGVGPVLAGLAAGVLATKLPWTLRDLAQSAAAVERQQVTLGHWIADNLDAGVRVGVNDTGAIAYVSGRSTFDVVGLTTEGEARYWVAGPGSRFEHYERLPRERLPTHFAVYPHWMACAPVLGAVLTDATVTDQSILGGATMTVYEARWDLLGSGAAPTAESGRGRVVDEVDVSDLESEAGHAFSIRGAWDGENVATAASAPAGVDGDGDGAGRTIADGGRNNRSRDDFQITVPDAAGRRLVLRVGAERSVELALRIADRDVGSVVVPPSTWVERAVSLDAAAPGKATVAVVARRAPPVDGEGEAGSADAEDERAPRFSSYHYWVVVP